MTRALTVFPWIALFAASSFTLPLPQKTDKPILQKGDTWLEEREYNGKKELVRIQVKEKGTPRYYLEVKSGREEWRELWDDNLTYDSTFPSHASTQRPERAMPRLQWPLEIGKKWTSEVMLEGLLLPRRAYLFQAEVEAIEYIETLQGKFFSYRIRSIVPRKACFILDFVFTDDDPQKNTEEVKAKICSGCRIRWDTWYYWYAPDVKAIVKSVGRTSSEEYLPGCPFSP